MDYPKRGVCSDCGEPTVDGVCRSGGEDCDGYGPDCDECNDTGHVSKRLDDWTFFDAPCSCEAGEAWAEDELEARDAADTDEANRWRAL